jgi:uncharacterized protein YcbK (DUF882 family)
MQTKVKPQACTRRHLLKLGLGAGLTLLTPGVAALAAVSEKRIALRNLHTGEHIDRVYWSDGQYHTGTLAEIDNVLRDHRSGEIFPIDPNLLDQLHALTSTLYGRRPFDVISGYRSPATNASLHAHSRGVARKSLHMQGKAIDIRLPGRALNDVHMAALAMRVGGVGYYPKSGFIHLDTGRVRHWF